ncbi:low molecular weight protein-tyrosine-phosphatase [Salinibius halmophilus]|uniref:low molecular weight protein-tyrosine-phosphatase n=1 Tax=Salinibius halmophilus TaxID=1853216 RepID=UPI000E675679|nr:low molecular weight protein-tyrosine-phosphatase [Salinibius halmophilus]
MTSVLFVCLGNICRSPTAEAVMASMIIQKQLENRLMIDSAGTAAYHIGKQPDARAIEHGKQRGYDLTPLRARQVSAEDFDQFDYILVMDKSNLENIQRIQSKNSRAQVALFLSYADSSVQEVPDPYYGGSEGFEAVLDLCESACNGFIEQVITK